MTGRHRMEKIRIERGLRKLETCNLYLFTKLTGLKKELQCQCRKINKKE